MFNDIKMFPIIFIQIYFKVTGKNLMWPIFVVQNPKDKQVIC